MTANEFVVKQGRIQALLDACNLDALLLRRASSFAWATCGASSFINMASTEGEAALLFAPSGRDVLTNQVESPRLEQEEKLADSGWRIVANPWHEPGTSLQALTKGLKVGTDVPAPGFTDLSREVSRLRARLLPEEGDRFRDVGRICAEAMSIAAGATLPGQTEHEIAAHLAAETVRRGAQPVVILVATDDRIFRFRHPLPTDKRLQKYAMLVLCARKWGLVGSITRFVHFGALPDELQRKSEAVARVDAAFIGATRPGRPLRDVFADGVAAYAAEGYAEEWRLHHQGGAAGYEPREFLGTPQKTESVVEGQAYAWNPSITGTKSEDTVLVGRDHFEVITAMDGWPTVRVAAGGMEIERPAIKVIT